MKTLKQIADGLGIPKQRVYRYVKANGIEGFHPSTSSDAGYSSTPHYDEAAESRIKSHFATQTVSADYISEAAFNAVVDTLREELESKRDELEAKNTQIDFLQNSLAAAQALHAATVKQLAETVALITSADTSSDVEITSSEAAQNQQESASGGVGASKTTSSDVVADTPVKRNFFTRLFGKA